MVWFRLELCKPVWTRFGKAQAQAKPTGLRLFKWFVVGSLKTSKPNRFDLDKKPNRVSRNWTVELTPSLLSHPLSCLIFGCNLYPSQSGIQFWISVESVIQSRQPFIAVNDCRRNEEEVWKDSYGMKGGEKAEEGYSRNLNSRKRFSSSTVSSAISFLLFGHSAFSIWPLLS